VLLPLPTRIPDSTRRAAPQPRRRRQLVGHPRRLPRRSLHPGLRRTPTLARNRVPFLATALLQPRDPQRACELSRRRDAPSTTYQRTHRYGGNTELTAFPSGREKLQDRISCCLC